MFHKKTILFLMGLTLLLAGIVTGCGSNEVQQEEDVVKEYAVASQEDVLTALEEGTSIVVDTRSGSAYMGWTTDGNEFGGHIEGATDFSASWLASSYDEKGNLEGISKEEYLLSTLENKGLLEEESVILYDENGEDAKAVASYLTENGIENISIFDLSQWTYDVVQYENYEMWVPTSAVQALISGDEVEELLDYKDPIILEVSWGTEEQSEYLNGHVPGAIHVNSDDFDDEENVYLLESDQSLIELATSLGIQLTSNVIVTGDPIFSCRYAVILKYLGVENVAVMSGNWSDAGYELETEANTPIPVTSFGADAPLNQAVIDTVEETEAFLETEDYTLVDNRTWEEYVGETSGYSYFEHAGRIKGAIYGYAGINNSSSMMYYRNVDGTMRNGEEILNMWIENGIDVDKHLAFMCGGGYRAAEVLWDAWVIGLTDSSLFADGWCGWALAGLKAVSGE